MKKNRVYLKKGSIGWAVVGNVAFKPEHITCMWDNGTEIVLGIVGMPGVPLTMSYAEAKKFFADHTNVGVH